MLKNGHFFDVIKDASGLKNSQNADGIIVPIANACLELHEKERDEFAIGFAWWIHENGYAPATTLLWRKTTENFQSPEQWNATFKTTKELLTIYKESLK